MRRDAYILAIWATCVAALFWQASRIVWSSNCQVTDIHQQSNEPTTGPLPEHEDRGSHKTNWAFQWQLQPPPGVADAASVDLEEGGREGRNGEMSTDIEATEVLLHASGVLKCCLEIERMLTSDAGNTVFKNLYIYDGTVHIVTDNPNTIPDLKHITSNGQSLNLPMWEPTERDIRVIRIRGAASGFGGRVVPWPRTTVRRSRPTP
jgi:hypothetical protein